MECQLDYLFNKKTYDINEITNMNDKMTRIVSAPNSSVQGVYQHKYALPSLQEKSAHEQLLDRITSNTRTQNCITKSGRYEQFSNELELENVSYLQLIST